MQEVVGEVEDDVGGDGEFGWRRHGAEWEAGHDGGDVVFCVWGWIGRPCGEALGGDPWCCVESSVCFFNVDLVAEDALSGVVEANVMDHVEESEECVAEQDPWDLFFIASLVDGELVFAAVGKVMTDPFFGNYFSTCIDCILVLESDWIYFCMF